MRLFIAIPLEETMKQTLLRIQEGFRDQGVKGTYTPKQNMHLTLAFIGEYGDPEEVADVLERIDFQPFRLELSGTGCFGDLWWAGLKESRELETLVKKVRRALGDAGIPFDRKKFRAHITLLRRAAAPHGIDLSRLPHSAASSTVDGFCLMQSTRGKSGMIYTELSRVPAR